MIDYALQVLGWVTLILGGVALVAARRMMESATTRLAEATARLKDIQALYRWAEEQDRENSLIPTSDRQPNVEA